MKRSKAWFIAATLLFCGILVTVKDARAWGYTWVGINLEKVVEATHWRSGLLRFNGAFAINNGGYDSDLYFGSTVTPVPDYTITGGPNIRFFLPLRRKLIFDVSVIPQYAYYFRTKKERGFENDFKGQVHFVLSRFYLRFSENLTDTRERLSTELNIRIRVRQDNPSGVVLWQLSPASSVALQYRQPTYTYENLVVGTTNIRQNLNRTEHYGNLTLYLAQTGKTRFFLDGEYGSFIFQQQVAKPKNTRSYTVFGGVDFVPDVPVGAETENVQRISGRLSLGFKEFNILNPGSRDYSGLVANTNLSIGLLALTAIHVSFLRDVQFSAYTDVTYYLATTYRVGVTQLLLRKVQLTYDLFFGKNSYPQISALQSATTNRFLNHAIGMALRVRKDLTVTLVGNIGQRNANFTDQIFRRSFVGVNIVYGYTTDDSLLLGTPVTRSY